MATTAKAGDAISKKARSVLKNALGLEQEVVLEKSPGNAGQWFCIDCGLSPENNMQMWGHQEAKPKHRIAWRSFTSGLVEEP